MSKKGKNDSTAQKIKSHDVFISYRENDGAADARIIKEKLEADHLNVFVAFGDAYKQSGSLPKIIRDAIDDSYNVIAVITNSTFNGESTQRNDWVANEIKRALDNGIAVVPVIVRKNLDWEKDVKPILPVDIQEISNEQALQVISGDTDINLKANIDVLKIKLMGNIHKNRQKEINKIKNNIHKKKSNHQIIQAKNTRDFLRAICKDCADELVKEGRSRLTVLDVGCGNGQLGRGCFRSPIYSPVYGIDNNVTLLKEAITSVRNPKSKYKYREFDIVKLLCEPREKFLEVLGDKQIKFDIIFCVMVLHNLKSKDFRHNKQYTQTIKILKKFKAMLKPGGYLIISNPDDSSKLFYEDDFEIEENNGTANALSNNIKSTLDKLVQLTGNISGGPDRYCGRATYYWLANAGFKTIYMRCLMQDTSKVQGTSKAQKPVDKFDLCNQLFGWQQTEIEELCEKGSIPVDKKKELQETVEELISRIRTKLDEDNSWLCSHDYVGIAKNDTDY